MNERHITSSERVIAEVPELPGVLVYGESREHAVAAVEALALRVIAELRENGEIAIAKLEW